MFRLAAIRPCKEKTNKHLAQYIMHVASNALFLHMEKKNKNMFVIILIYDKRFVVWVEPILRAVQVTFDLNHKSNK